jgi:hypothetical protein
MRFIDLTPRAGVVLATVVCILAAGAAAPVSPAKSPAASGKIVQIRDFVWINGKLAHGTRKVFAGNLVKTLSSGQARLEITQPKSSCTNAAEVKVIVAPQPHVVMQLVSGTLVCTMIARHNCRDGFKAGRNVMISSCDPAFAIIVKPRRVVVKVTRGFVVVAGPGGRRAAVLVGRNRQVVVPAGRDPQAPVPLVLTAKERKAFAVLVRTLPPDRDHTPPPAKITAEPPAATSSSTATFSFAAAERNVTFTCSLDGRPFRLCSSPASYAGLAPGAHTFALSATDEAGNTASAGSYSWTVDTHAPVATITSPNPATTSATSATFSFVADEPAVSFECGLDGAAFAACTSPATFSGLASGAHSFSVRAIDAARNVGPPAPLVSWTVDTRAPAVTVSSDRPATTNATSVTFTFKADKSPVTFACQLDAGALAACTSPKAYVRLAEGRHTFLVRATDSLGNVGTTKYTWTIDVTGPTVTITSAPPNPVWTTSSSGANATFAFSAGEAPVVFTCRLDSSPPAACSSPRTYTAVPPGQHTFTVWATDTVGNVGPSVSYSWEIDVIVR